MTIKFESNVIDHGKKRNIEFESQVEIGEYGENNEMITFNFKEPSRGIENRFEISETKVNIFAGPGTIYLNKEKDIENPYNISLENGKIITINLWVHVEEIEIDPLKFYRFKYYIYQYDKDNKKDILNDIEIKLTLSGDLEAYNRQKQMANMQQQLQSFLKNKK